ncbi:MAG: sodium-dependent transporter [Planctomycetes bacterium]|nr:sodium-dependent transporter [Planctomycetota bacterium]
MEQLSDNRESWGSRPGFILAAIGSAVGLGNVWRFPNECYANGGAAFLIPYIVAMIIIGIPLLIMEFSLGHLTRKAAPLAFKHVGKKWEFAGWWPIVMNFTILCYYSVIIAWVLNYCIYSFNLGWGDDTDTFFFNNYLDNNGTFALGGMRWPIVASLATIWVIMYLCIFKGVEVIGKVVLLIVPIPWLMLVILVIRGVTLDGATQGLEYYLEPNWSYLSRATVWRDAFAQVFFSVTIAFGVMITYASFLPKKSDISNNAMIIAVSDLATSFIAGLAIFATMGYLAYQKGMPVEEVLDTSESLGLAFVAFPAALSKLAFGNIFALIFFFSLLLLGIDSGFSMTQTILASLCDKTKWKRGTVLLILSVIGFFISIIFSTRGGLQWLGITDGAVNEGFIGILFLGLVQCLILGWSFGAEKLRDHANETSDWQLPYFWIIGIRFLIPFILIVLVSWNIYSGFKGVPLELADDEFADPAALAVTINDSDDPLSNHIKQNFSPESSAILAEFIASKAVYDELVQPHVEQKQIYQAAKNAFENNKESELLSAGQIEQTKQLLGQQKEDLDQLWDSLRDSILEPNRKRYSDLKQTKGILVEEINMFINTDQVIYQPDLFQNIRLTDDTRFFLDQYQADPENAVDPVRLNRMLIQDAYAGMINPSANIGGFFIDARGQLVGNNIVSFIITLLFFLIGVILALWKPKVTVTEVVTQ